MTRILTTPDGRDLEIDEAGKAGGPLIVAHGGTPASGRLEPSHIADVEARDARIVTIGRPGYGRSTRQPGRSVADVAADVRFVLDELGVDRCVTWGESGGGPHALACAALLPDRVAAAASLAAVAPVEAEGLDWMAGMGADNVEEFGAALEGEEPVRAFIEAQVPMLAAITGDQIADSLQTLVSDVDRAAISGEYGDGLAVALRHAVSTGGDGWVDDDLAFTKPWGFALSDIKIPVLLWQGDHDLMVPPTHGAWLAERIPGVDARLSPDDGHLTLTAHRIPEIHDWLLAHL